MFYSYFIYYFQIIFYNTYVILINCNYLTLIKNLILFIIKLVINLENNKKLNIGILLFRLISLIIILICIFLLYRWNSENNENAEIADDLANEFVNTSYEQNNENSTSSSNYELLEINFDELLNQNEDTVAWIKVNNTNINFPIVQVDNNNFYLKHNFKKQYNSAGWIFADYTNNFDTLDKNTIIYGHNRRNNTMFSNLKSLLNPSWFNNELNKYFYFNTKSTNYIAKIFSVYKINQNKLNLFNSFENEESFNQYITEVKQKSIYDFNLEISFEDNLITLCTCDDNNKYRIVIYAKLETIN